MNLSISQTGLVGTVMFLGSLLTAGWSGVLAIRWGAKTVLLSGGFLVLVAIIGISASSYFWMICLFMLLSDVTPLMSIVIGRFPEKRGMALGNSAKWYRHWNAFKRIYDSFVNETLSCLRMASCLH